MLTPLYRGLTPLVLPAPAFSPLSLSPVAWYDFSDLTTLWQDTARTTPAVSDTDPVGGITDKSGNGNHLSQSFSTKRPALKLAIQNGRAVLRFDGVDDFLLKTFGASLSQPTTVFIAFRQPATWTEGFTILDGATGNKNRLFQHNATPSLSLFAGVIGATNTQLPLNTFGLAGCIFNGNSSSLTINNGTASSSNSGTNSTDGLTIGAFGAGGANFTATDVGELIICNPTLLTAGQVTSMWSYLNGRWSVY